MLWAVLALITLFPVGSCAESTTPSPGFKVLHASSSLDQDRYTVDIDFALLFSDESLEALDNGVPVVIVVEYEVLEQRDYLWDKTILEMEDRFELRYQSLTKRHLITDLATGKRQSYGRRFSAVNALSRIEDRPIVFLSQLDPGKNYQAKVRIHLDIEALPAPLRLPAYLSKEWDLQSDWYEWPLQVVAEPTPGDSNGKQP